MTSKDYVEFLNDETLDNNFSDDCLPRTTGLPGKSCGEPLYDMWNAYGKAAPVWLSACPGSSGRIGGTTTRRG